MYIENSHQRLYVTTEDYFDFPHYTEHSPADC